VLLTKPLQREDIAYLQTWLDGADAQWVLVDRHTQHLQHMTELLADMGVTDVVADTEGQGPEVASDRPIVFVWDMLAPLPDTHFIPRLQQQVMNAAQRLIVAMVDASLTGPAVALESREHGGERRVAIRSLTFWRCHHEEH